MPFDLDAAHVDVAIRYRHSVPICSLAAIAGVDIARSRELARGALATAPTSRRSQGVEWRGSPDAGSGFYVTGVRQFGLSSSRSPMMVVLLWGRTRRPVSLHELGDVQSGETGGSLGDGDDGVLWSALDVAGVGGGRFADRVGARQLQRADAVAEMGLPRRPGAASSAIGPLV